MAKLFDVANFFIDMAMRRGDEDMSNLKLNKLMYFAQGCYLARTGKCLFDDKIEAWEYGPVVPAIYRKYSKYGKKPIDQVDGDYTLECFISDERETLIDVMHEMGCYTASKLVDISHRMDAPWSVTDINQPISETTMKEYFSRPENAIKKYSSQRDNSLPNAESCKDIKELFAGFEETYESCKIDWGEPVGEELW